MVSITKCLRTSREMNDFEKLKVYFSYFRIPWRVVLNYLYAAGRRYEFIDGTLDAVFDYGLEYGPHHSREPHTTKSISYRYTGCRWPFPHRISGDGHAVLMGNDWEEEANGHRNGIPGYSMRYIIANLNRIPVKKMAKEIGFSHKWVTVMLKKMGWENIGWGKSSHWLKVA